MGPGEPGDVWHEEVQGAAAKYQGTTRTVDDGGIGEHPIDLACHHARLVARDDNRGRRVAGHDLHAAFTIAAEVVFGIRLDGAVVGDVDPIASWSGSTPESPDSSCRGRDVYPD